MPHRTRQAIVRWAASVLLVLVVASYVWGYLFVGERVGVSTFGPPDTPPYSAVLFTSPLACKAFIPLALIEANLRRRIIILDSETYSLECRPIEWR